MWIRLQDDHLTTQLAGQPQLPIFAESETKKRRALWRISAGQLSE
jgi:hypothetical protein